MKKNLNDRILDKSGEFFLMNIMHIVFDFRRVQLVGSLKVYSSYWWVLLGSWRFLILLGSAGFLVGSDRFLFKGLFT